MIQLSKRQIDANVYSDVVVIHEAPRFAPGFGI